MCAISEHLRGVFTTKHYTRVGSSHMSKQH